MKVRHWLRRDVIWPVIYLAVFGFALFWLNGQLEDLPAAEDSVIIYWAERAMIVLYVLLVLITIRHILSTYDLERYDPGNLSSLKRLMRRHRFRLGRREIPTQALLVQYEQYLLAKGFQLETDSHLIGRVYVRRLPLAFLLRAGYERVILLQHEPLNVFMIDQILQDAIRYIRSQEAAQSRRNLIVLITRMQEAEEVASCGAGVVNFLGRFRGGTLGAMLLATRQRRLFYPADRTLQPRIHRWFQNRHHHKLRSLIFQLQHSQPGPAVIQSDDEPHVTPNDPMATRAVRQSAIRAWDRQAYPPLEGDAAVEKPGTRADRQADLPYSQNGEKDSQMHAPADDAVLDHDTQAMQDTQMLHPTDRPQP